MYPKFIEVHDGADAMSVNTANIEWFADETISMKDCEVRVLESYDDLKALITDVGCLIHKKDPRMDLTSPLTIDDLKDMIGEPVWNSNSGEWGLVTKDPEWRGDIQEGYYIRYHDGTLTLIEDEYLIKYPLYRMKRA